MLHRGGRARFGVRPKLAAIMVSGRHLISVTRGVEGVAHLDQVRAEPRPQPARRTAWTRPAGRRAQRRCRMTAAPAPGKWPGAAYGTDVWHLRCSGRQGPLAPAAWSGAPAKPRVTP